MASNNFSIYGTSDAWVENYTPSIFEGIKKDVEGDRESQFILGNDYIEGKKVKESRFMALRCYKKASKQGHQIASYNVGCLYQSGIRDTAGNLLIISSTKAVK